MLEGSLYYLGLEPAPVHPSAPDAAGPEARAAGWMGAVRRWRAVPSSAADPSLFAAGAWAAVIRMPEDAVGQGLVVDGRRIRVGWGAEPPFRTARDGAGAAGSPQPWLFAALEPVRASPLDRWRGRMALRAAGVGRESFGDTFSDPILEAWAAQAEAEWHVALERLAAADRVLAARLEGRLAGVVDFGGGVRLPAWNAAPSSLRSLLADLSALDLSARERAERARGWLNAQPAGAAWVVDDGGATDAGTGGLVSTVGVANLSDVPAACWAGAPEAGGAPEISEVPPVAAGRVAAANPAPTRGSPATTTRLTVRVGEWGGSRTAIGRRVPVVPPGAGIGPLSTDLTMETLAVRGSQPDAVGPPGTGEGAASLMGTLLRQAPPGDPGEGGTPRRGWTVYIECADAPPAGGPTGEHGGDEVRLFVGPYGSPSAVLRLFSDGQSEVQTLRAGTAAAEPARFTRVEGGWACWAPVPPEAVEADGTLRLGVVRIEPSGRRSAWPRAMAPWQFEPGRVAFDLSAWTGLGGSRPAEAGGSEAEGR